MDPGTTTGAAVVDDANDYRALISARRYGHAVDDRFQVSASGSAFTPDPVNVAIEPMRVRRQYLKPPIGDVTAVKVRW